MSGHDEGKRSAHLSSGGWTTEVALPFRLETTRYFPVEWDGGSVVWGAPIRVAIEVDQAESPDGPCWVATAVEAATFQRPLITLPSEPGQEPQPSKLIDIAHPDPAAQAEIDRLMRGDAPRPMDARDAETIAALITPDGLGTAVQVFAAGLQRRQASGAPHSTTQAEYMRERARAGSKRATRTDADFRQIAELVRGRAIGSTPALAVQQGLPCSRARAYQLLKEAGELGYLEEVEITGRKNDA